jgi:hypothetical protein
MTVHVYASKWPRLLLVKCRWWLHYFFMMNKAGSMLPTDSPVRTIATATTIIIWGAAKAAKQ